MEEYEEGCGSVCIEVPYLLASEGQASEASGFVATFAYSRVEMGACYDGFCCGSFEDSTG